MKKYCDDCGFENASDDKFCRNCGKELIDLNQIKETKEDGSTGKKTDLKSSEKQTKDVVPKKEKQPKQETEISNIEPSPKEEDSKKQKPSVYPIGYSSHRRITPSQGNFQTKDMSKKLLIIAGLAIILSVVAIVLAFAIQPSLEIDAETIGTNELKNNAITGDKVLDGSLTDSDIVSSGISKIAANSITGDMIQSGTIIFNHLSSDVIASIAGQVNITNNSITSNKIADGTIIAADLDDDSITSAKIKDGEVTIDDIGENAVGSSEIAANAVGASEIQNGAVDTSELASDAVTYEKMDIKIRSGVETYAQNGSIISHDLDVKPSSVIVTPIHDENINGGGYALYANVYDVTSSNFKITLWYQEDGTSTLEEVAGTPPWDEIEVYWIAIYTP